MPYPRFRPVTLGPFAVLIAGLAASACGPSYPPFSTSSQGRVVLAQAMDGPRAAAVLARLPERQRRYLRQLIFIANLQMASGNEKNPARLYARTARELAQPVALRPELADWILAHMHRVVSALPNTRTYGLVKAMLGPVQGALPSVGDCLQKILAFPEPVAVAFLFREYFADDHYHRYNLRGAILRALAYRARSPAPLLIYAHYLRTSYPSKSRYSRFGRVALAARGILGRGFEPWYYEIRGKTYPN